MLSHGFFWGDISIVVYFVYYLMLQKLISRFSMRQVFFFLARESWPFIHVMWPETKCLVRSFFPFVSLWVGKKKGDTKKMDAFGYLRVFPHISSGFSWFIPHACALLNAHVY